MCIRVRGAADDENDVGVAVGKCCCLLSSLPSLNLTATNVNRAEPRYLLITAPTLLTTIKPASQASLSLQPQARVCSLSPLPKLAPPTLDRSRCHEDKTAVPPHFHLFPISNTNLEHAYRVDPPPSAICYTISPGAWPRTDRASISGVGDSPSAMAAMTLSEQTHPHSNRLIYPRG